MNSNASCVLIKEKAAILVLAAMGLCGNLPPRPFDRRFWVGKRTAFFVRLFALAGKRRDAQSANTMTFRPIQMIHESRAAPKAKLLHDMSASVPAFARRIMTALGAARKFPDAQGHCENDGSLLKLLPETPLLAKEKSPPPLGSAFAIVLNANGIQIDAFVVFFNSLNASARKWLFPEIIGNVKQLLEE